MNLKAVETRKLKDDQKEMKLCPCLLCAAVLLAMLNTGLGERGSWWSRKEDAYEYYASLPNVSRTFVQSQNACREGGGELARPKEAIHYFIVSLAGNETGSPYAFYFGYKRKSWNDGYWWTDCTEGGDEMWKSGEPQPGNRRRGKQRFCAVMGMEPTYETSLPWYSSRCDSEVGYVCQRLKTNQSTPEPTTSDCFKKPKITPTTSYITERDSTLGIGSTSPYLTQKTQPDSYTMAPVIIAVPGCILLIIVVAATVYIYRKNKEENVVSEGGFVNRMYVGDDGQREYAMNGDNTSVTGNAVSAIHSNSLSDRTGISGEYVQVPDVLTTHRYEVIQEFATQTSESSVIEEKANPLNRNRTSE